MDWWRFQVIRGLLDGLRASVGHGLRLLPRFAAAAAGLPDTPKLANSLTANSNSKLRQCGLSVFFVLGSSSCSGGSPKRLPTTSAASVMLADLNSGLPSCGMPAAIPAAWSAVYRAKAAGTGRTGGYFAAVGAVGSVIGSPSAGENSGQGLGGENVEV